MLRPEAVVLPESALVKGEQSASASASPPAAPYLKRLHAAVRRQFANATGIAALTNNPDVLSPEERTLVVRQALLLIDQNYAHLPLKRAMHCVDPVQRLRLLLRSLEHSPADVKMSDVDFHHEMTDIFTSVRDLHTNYLLPAPFNGLIAFLPFMVEVAYEGGEPVYLVSHVTPGFTHPTFKAGVEVRYWNGTPIHRAVLSNAQRYAGSNHDARVARGVQTLTTRALIVSPPPDEEWVIVGYRTPSGQDKELRLDWIASPPLASESAEGASGGGAASASAFMGIDLEQETIQQARKSLFAPDTVQQEKDAAQKMERGEAFTDDESTLPGIFQARPVTTPGGTFGYLRIRSFDHWPPQEFVDEFVRLIAALPQNGLILDVRGNGGGVIMNGEMILQTLTPRPIEPEPVQFINTPLNLQICRHNDASSSWSDLSVWTESMEQALQTGATFSAGFPLSDPGLCNALGQKYFGPVVLIIDALCYSTTDLFSAGFQDHEIGPVLGIDGATGAGGANVWTHEQLATSATTDATYEPLPGGIGMRVAIRRSLRVGKRSGTPVEDLGVVPDERHLMTRNDLLGGNADLIAKAGSLLSGRPVRALSVTATPIAPTQVSVVAETRGMTRLDLYLDGRPIETADVSPGPTAFTVNKPSAAPATLEIRGFDGNEPVARYRTAA